MAPASPVELNPAEPLRVAARRVVAARREDLDGIAPGAVGSSDPEATSTSPSFACITTPRRCMTCASPYGA